ncbi:hypothetical protein [Exiguobacterium sp. s133]|uniref:hypothetical protein n=1 Tax=Exiguobacterium sp. s133 TaxID=2751213 RepID=UPI001BEC1298|nr:hypothetical protein [Exiguobacterium sp. s133]
MWIRQLPEPIKIEITGFLGKLLITSTLKTELGPVLRLLLKGAAQGAEIIEIMKVTDLSESVVREQADWLIRRGMLEEQGGKFILTLNGNDLYERLIVSERLDSGGWNVFFDVDHERIMFENHFESVAKTAKKVTPSLYQKENPYNTLELVEATMPPEEVMDQFKADQLALKLQFQKGISPHVRPFILRAMPTYFEEVGDTSVLVETSSNISIGPYFDFPYLIECIHLKQPSILQQISDYDWEQLKYFREMHPSWLSTDASLLLQKKDMYENFKEISMYMDNLTGSFSTKAPLKCLQDGEDFLEMDRSLELLRQFEKVIFDKGYDMEMFEVQYNSFYAIKKIPVSWLEDYVELEVKHESWS